MNLLKSSRLTKLVTKLTSALTQANQTTAVKITTTRLKVRRMTATLTQTVTSKLNLRRAQTTLKVRMKASTRFLMEMMTRNNWNLRILMTQKV